MSQKSTYEELEQKIAYLEKELSARKRSEALNGALLQISNAANITTSLHEFFKTIHFALSAVLDTTNFFIALYDQVNDSITFPYCIDEVDQSYPPVVEISKTASLTAEVIRTGKPLMINKEDVVRWRAEINLPLPTCTPAAIWLGVPLQLKGKMIGVMAVQNYFDSGCYDQTDLNLMVSVAELAAIALSNMEVEEALRLSEGKFRLLFDLAVDGILLGSDEGHIIEANVHMAELTGIPRQELIGLHINQLSFTKESMARSPFRFDLLKKGSTVIAERVLVRPDGSEVPVEMRTKMLPNGTYQSIYSDITKRKEAEKALREAQERFRLAFLTSPDAISINKIDGTYVDVNLGFTEMTGYSREEVLGRSSLDIAIWDRYEDRQSLVETLKREGQIRNIESCFRMKDGTKKIGLLSGNIIQLGGESHILSITRDISLLKKTEQEKYELEVKYMQSQKMEAIGIMAGGIAHDFNNMLAIIMGNAEVALLTLPKESSETYCVNQIVTASRRVKELVKQILTFSRQTDQELLPLDPCLVIKESLQLLRSTIPTTVNIIQHLTEDCRLIMADPTQLHQLLMNLCTNAVHAMGEKGTLKVTGIMVELADDAIDHQPDLHPGCYLKLSVADTGTGIAKGIRERIFDPFFTTKDVHEGTGMGLSMVLGIVKSHKGFLQVESRPGEGTIFTIYFPALENGPTDQKEEVSAQQKYGNGRILFVDDEEMLAVMGGRILENLGYTVTVKLSSKDALETFRATPEAFDVVMTDQSMPEMSGLELSIQLLKIRPDIPIILCTGYSKKITEKEALLLGIKKYMTKPFSTKRLAQCIRDVMS